MGTNAKIIDGKKLAGELKDSLKLDVQHLKDTYKVTPRLAILRIGEHPASKLYVASKGTAAKEIGLGFKEYHFPQRVTQPEILEKITDLNQDPTVHGILVQLPLPLHLHRHTILSAIDPQKDVDGLHPQNMGKLLENDPTGLVPCTPQGCKHLLDHVYPTLVGKDILMIGASYLVGRPMAALMTNEDATVTLAHSLTRDLPKLCKQAEIMIVAIGDPLFIQADWIKPGATVIDVGINHLDDGAVVGDVDFENARKVAGAITPVPGGVGPMTVASLLRNTFIAAEHILTTQ